MHFLITISSLIGATLATAIGHINHEGLEPLRRRQSSASAITITWEKNLVSGDLATSAWDATSSILYNFSCANGLKIGDKTYVFDTTDQGAGTIQINNKKYSIQPDPKDGISCLRRFNDDFAITDCQVPVPPGLDAATPLDADDISKCFSHSPKGNHADINTTEATVPTKLGRRQRCSEIRFFNELAHPNKDPGKWTRAEQVTPTLQCQAADQCGVALQKSGTLTYEGSIFGGGPWFGAGFAVSQSVTNGWEQSCLGHSQQTVCIWTWAQYQEYNVRYEIKNACGAVLDTRDSRIRSPMSDGNHHFGTYCVIDTCRGNNDWYWVDEGPGTW